MRDNDGPNLFPINENNAKSIVDAIDERQRRNAQNDASLKANRETMRKSMGNNKKAIKRKKIEAENGHLTTGDKVLAGFLALTVLSVAIIAWQILIERIDARSGPPPTEPSITQQYEGGSSVGK